MIPIIVATRVAQNAAHASTIARIRRGLFGYTVEDTDEAKKKRKLMVKQCKELIDDDRTELRLKDKVYPPGARGARERLMDRFKG